MALYPPTFQSHIGYRAFIPFYRKLGTLPINLRAAGVIAGVVLERHLQRTAVNHEIIIEKKEPTISDLNDPLKKENIYDIPTWRLIQVLGDIRNLCVHNKEREPTAEEVKRLIKETDIIIKTIF